MNILFDNAVNRRDTNSCKWDSLDKKYNNLDMIHLGVADMDFKCPKPILNAIQNIVNNGVFGYTDLNDNFYESFIYWMKNIHNVNIKREEIVFCPRINISSSMCVNLFTNPDDEVIINVPAYGPLYQAILKNKRKVLESPLKRKENSFVIDFEELENKITEKTKMFILCSPHNPTGRVWTKEELEKISDFCLRHNLILFSDEIHSDILAKNVKFTSMLCMNENIRNNLIMVTSPAKTFNTPGLIISYMVIPNEKLRQKIKDEIDRIGMHNPNIFSVVATETAYTKCIDWYNQLLNYINENDQFTRKFFKENMPKFQILEREGTFLLWIDYSKIGCSEETLEKWFIEDAKVSVYMGSVFQKEGYNYIRVNIATSKKMLLEAYTRMLKVYNKLF